MDLGTAVVTLAVGAIAVLPRVPALTEAGRAQAVIRRDIELWSALPAGTARDRLGTHIEERTVVLLDERQRDKRVETGWLVGTGFAGVGELGWPTAPSGPARGAGCRGSRILHPCPDCRSGRVEGRSQGPHPRQVSSDATSASTDPGPPSSGRCGTSRPMTRLARRLGT
jgi:hypothetical protein